MKIGALGNPQLLGNDLPNLPSPRGSKPRVFHTKHVSMLMQSMVASCINSTSCARGRHIELEYAVDLTTQSMVFNV